MLLNALGGRRKPAEHRCNPYEALAQGISDQRGLAHVARITFTRSRRLISPEPSRLGGRDS